VKAWSLFTWCDDAVARARGVGARRGRADVRGRYGDAEVVHDEAAIESEGPTLRSSRARRKLGLDQPTAVIQCVRLDTGNENHLSPMEVRDVARRMILIVAMLAGPVKAAQKAPLFIQRRQGILDRCSGSAESIKSVRRM